MNVIRCHQGQRIRVLGDQVTIKLPSAQSANGMAIVFVDVPPGSGTPCVAHAQEEEVYLLLEGELLMHEPGEQHRLERGDLVHLPAGTPHGYRNPGTKPARFVAWTVGGPMDRFFVAMSEEVHELPRDLTAMGRLMQTFGVQRA